MNPSEFSLLKYFILSQFNVQVQLVSQLYCRYYKNGATLSNCPIQSPQFEGFWHGSNCTVHPIGDRSGNAVVPFGAASCVEITCIIFPATRLDNPCIDWLVNPRIQVLLMSSSAAFNIITKMKTVHLLNSFSKCCHYNIFDIVACCTVSSSLQKSHFPTLCSVLLRAVYQKPVSSLFFICVFSTQPYISLNVIQPLTHSILSIVFCHLHLTFMSVSLSFFAPTHMSWYPYKSYP